MLRNVPNALSLARLLAAPVLVGLAAFDYQRVFAVLLIAALVTDILDGWVARRFGLQTTAGAALDSAGDVATLVAAAVGIACFHPEVWHRHGIAIGAVLGGWALVCALALRRYRRLSSFHTYLSKAAGYALGFFIAVLFVFDFVPWLFYLAVGMSLASCAEELALLWRLPQWRADVRGLWWVMRESRSDFE